MRRDKGLRRFSSMRTAPQFDESNFTIHWSYEKIFSAAMRSGKPRAAGNPSRQSKSGPIEEPHMGNRLARNILLAAAAGLAGTGVLSAQEFQKVNVNVQGGWATAGIYQEIEVPFWTERLPSLTGGNVTATISSLNEKGLKGPEVFRLMRMGVIDFGTSALGYVAGDDPQNEGSDL